MIFLNALLFVRCRLFLFPPPLPNCASGLHWKGEEEEGDFFSGSVEARGREGSSEIRQCFYKVLAVQKVNTYSSLPEKNKKIVINSELAKKINTKKE